MRRFLIVDDDPACRRVLKHHLSYFGWCDLAYDGHEGVAAFRIALEKSEPYDAVFLDIMMPTATGHDALRKIREIEESYGIGGKDGVKVIMTTGLADSKHCVQAFREGCESFLTKPVEKRALLARLRELGLAPTCEPRDTSLALG